MNCQFSNLFEDFKLDNRPIHVSFFRDVTWPSLNNALVRFSCFLKRIRTFLQRKRGHVPSFMTDLAWSIFSHRFGGTSSKYQLIFARAKTRIIVFPDSLQLPKTSEAF